MRNIQSADNLDFYCVDYAQKISSALSEHIDRGRLSAADAEHALGKTLSVLHNSGVYAFCLHITYTRNSGARAERRISEAVDNNLFGQRGAATLLRTSDVDLPITSANNALEAGKILSQNLDNLFLAKELIQRCLIYARHHVKALT
ncbi:MAG: hypothetical protein ACE5PV_13610 [Candidatus Poribacteria bacterium]